MKVNSILISALILLCNYSSGQVTIILDEIPENTPSQDPIHVAGDFQGWNPGNKDYILYKDSVSGLHTIVLYYITGNIEFKFTRGDWDKVESNDNGGFLPDRKHKVLDGDTLRLQILGWEDLDGNGGGTSTAAENVQILTDSFYMPQLNRYRRIWIYLPPDYGQTNYSYPVLYMHDGQNVFDARTSFAGEWRVDETLNELYDKGDSGVIVVAIDHGGSSRMIEYTPWENRQYGGGDGDKYLQFLVNDLKPFIDDNYRTISDRNHTGIMGSSLGGLISTYAALKYGDTFGKIGAFSPAYWINPEIFELVSESEIQGNTRIYQNVGTGEGETYVNQMFAMQDSLLANGIENEDLWSIEKTDGAHSEWFWAREFEDAYLFLFRNKSSHIVQPNLAPYHVEIYPNPTQNVINLRIAAQNRIKITATLVDINGKLVAPLINDTIEAGVQNFHFNNGLFIIKPGIYFVRIESEGAIKTKIQTILE